MSKLTAKARNAIPTSKFGLPGERKYPLNNRSHAQNALARVSQHGTPAEQKAVRAKVHAMYPAMGNGDVMAHKRPNG